MPAVPRRAGRKPQVPLRELLPALVFHFMNFSGTLAQHAALLFGRSLAETGAQEIAAIVIASALLARERQRAARGQTPVLRMSFAKTLALMLPLWLMLQAGRDLLSEEQKWKLTARIFKSIRQSATRPRSQPRSCPRAVLHSCSCFSRGSTNSQKYRSPWRRRTHGARRPHHLRAIAGRAGRRIWRWSRR